MTNNNDNNKINFEASLKRLEEIVHIMESGDVSLDNSMALFEEGTTLIRRLNNILDTAEQQVMQIMKKEDGSPDLLPFMQKEQ